MEVKDKVVTVEGLKGAYDNLDGKITQLNNMLKSSFSVVYSEESITKAGTSEITWKTITLSAGTYMFQSFIQVQADTSARNYICFYVNNDGVPYMSAMSNVYNEPIYNADGGSGIFVFSSSVTVRVVYLTPAICRIGYKITRIM